MMMSLHGRPSDLDAFDFFLAQKLGCFVADLDRMSNAEYVGWAAYYEATQAMTDQKRVG
jgi:hypothetical protein